MTNISIIIPTLNEKENLCPLVAEINRFTEHFAVELIIVDDNSKDGTAAEAIALSADYNIQLIRRLHRKGLSSAILDGLAAAKSEFMIVMDADLQHAPSILPQMIELLEKGNDLVIGTRIKVPHNPSNRSRIRMFATFVATQIAKLTLPKVARDTRDPVSGYFGITRDFFDQIGSEINPRGFKILFEFLAGCKDHKIEEVEYEFGVRQFGHSKMSASIGLNFLVAAYSAVAGNLIPVLFLQFVMVGFTGLFVNEGTLALLLKFTQAGHQIALIFAIFLSIQTNFFLNNFWTFKAYAFRAPGPLLRGLLHYNIVCFVGALINYSVALLLVNADIFSIYLANLAGVVLASFWNYTISTHSVWKAET